MKDKNIHIIHQYLNREIDIETVKQKLSSEEFQDWKKTLAELDHLPKPDFNTDQEFEKLQKKRQNLVESKPNVSFLKIAAVLIVLLTTSLFIITYNSQDLISVSSAEAKQEVIKLPDNSLVRLNAMSTISYSQDDWKSSRTLALDGEAYFDVEEGQTFTVETPNGKVQVLGTTFNVKSKGNHFSVTCYSGKVKVNFTDIEVILQPGQVIDNANQKISLTSTTKPHWMLNRSSFESTPLAEVIVDIETQKGIDIRLKLSESINFTGAYNHDMEAEDIIDMVCRSLDLNYKKLNSSTFEISSAEE